MRKLVTINTQPELSFAILQAHILSLLNSLEKQGNNLPVMPEIFSTVIREDYCIKLLDPTWSRLRLVKEEICAAREIINTMPVLQIFTNQLEEWEGKLKSYTIKFRNVAFRLKCAFQEFWKFSDKIPAITEVVKMNLLFIYPILGEADAIIKLSDNNQDKIRLIKVYAALATAYTTAEKWPQACKNFHQALAELSLLEKNFGMRELNYDYASVLLRLVETDLRLCSTSAAIIDANLLPRVALVIKGYSIFFDLNFADQESRFGSKDTQSMLWYLNALHKVAMVYARIREKISIFNASELPPVLKECVSYELRLRKIIAGCLEGLPENAYPHFMNYIRHFNLLMLSKVPGAEVMPDNTVTIEVIKNMRFKNFDNFLNEDKDIKSKYTSNQHKKGSRAAKKEVSMRLFHAPVTDDGGTHAAQPQLDAKDQSLLNQLTKVDWSKECPWNKGVPGGFAMGWKC